MFVNIRNLNRNGGRAVFHGVSNGRRIFGGKLQHRFLFPRLRIRDLLGIAKHDRLRVMIVVYVHVKIDLLLFFRAVLIIIISHAHVLQDRRIIIDGERERIGVFLGRALPFRRSIGKEFEIHAILPVRRECVFFGAQFKLHVRGRRRAAARIGFAHAVDKVV